MAGSKTRIDELRAEIDGLDDVIHDLLMHRAELARKVGRLKREGGESTLFMRSGREAEVVRHVLGRHQGPFPRAAIFRIWREIIGGTLCVEGPLSLAVEAADGALPCALRELARDHFGIAAPLLSCADWRAVLDALGQGRANVGVLAMPRPGERDPWWTRLAEAADPGLAIVARLPFLEPAGGAAVAALVLAKTAFEPSGDDMALVALETSIGVARPAVLEALKAAGFSGEPVADDGRTRHLLALEGHASPADARFGALKAGAVVKRFAVLGGFARPLVETR